jgi:catechol 2,3-dioxygenase-like lactoylglutathione lyase family enzyme
MPTPAINEFKTFIPSSDYDLSRQFYLDFGFELHWEAAGHLCVFRAGPQLFAVQNAFLQVPAGDYVLHLLVPDLDAWYEYLLASGLAEKYGTQLNPPQMRPWGLRDLFFRDPSGNLWRVAEASKE